MGADLWIIFYWWTALFLIGAVSFPLAKRIFTHWWDQGYAFSKAIGMAFVTLFVWYGGMLHILPFSTFSIVLAMGTVFVVGLAANYIHLSRNNASLTFFPRKTVNANKLFHWDRIVMEEAVFAGLLFFWSWIKGHEASIHSLEKYMDYGFTKSILASVYFPPGDMWFAGHSINYYYFGHTVLAMLTRLSGISLLYTFNLMLATIFALSAIMSFAIGVQLMRFWLGTESKSRKKYPPFIRTCILVIAGVCTSFLVTISGNMQTIYAFTKGYSGEDPPAFWTLLWSRSEFWSKIGEGMNKYWYANATRFIPLTIHEFPGYSFVVSDIHGHVLSIPFVLLAIALLLTIFVYDHYRDHETIYSSFRKTGLYIVFGSLVGILFMTNALDGPIYAGLFVILLLTMDFVNAHLWKSVKTALIPLSFAGASGAFTVVPFVLTFSSFVSGIGINCPHEALQNKKIGLFLFETVDKCQHTPLWMWWLLWGFFVFCGIWFILLALRKKIHFTHRPSQDIFWVIVFVFCLLLLVFPEFFYFKDIYPAHFRSNTMFKLGYQAFIMLSILSGFTIIRILIGGTRRIITVLFAILLLPQLFLVSIYPVFAVYSYFGNLREYSGLYGFRWFEMQYAADASAISWLNTHVVRNSLSSTLPVIVEADGDSYTDYARVSAFTGLPTIIGWPVHEWLWRGTYDVVAPRRDDVRLIYESTDPEEVKMLLSRYHASYIFIGTLEREKYIQLNESLIASIGQEVFREGNTVIYYISNDTY